MFIVRRWIGKDYDAEVAIFNAQSWSGVNLSHFYRHYYWFCEYQLSMPKNQQSRLENSLFKKDGDLHVEQAFDK